MAEKEWPVKVVPIERITQHSLRSAQVTFNVDRGEFAPELKIAVNVSADVDDASLVPIARSYLARTFRRLSEQTANWVLTEEQYTALVPEKPSQ